MTDVDIVKLRELISAHREDVWKRDGCEVYGNHTKYSFGSFEQQGQTALAVAAVNALPALLVVYEAARKACDGFHETNDASEQLTWLRLAVEAVNEMP